MKHFDYRILAEDMTRGRNPRPFAGKFPTRIAFVVFNANGSVAAQYLGKPNRLQLARLQRLGRKRDRSLRVVEFDTNGPIAISSHQRGWNSSPLWDLYHPWDAAVYPRDWQFLWFQEPFWVKRIGGFRLYSSRELLRREDVQNYRARLMDVGLLRAKAGLSEIGTN